MCKACFAALPPSDKRSRSLRRYLDLADQSGLLWRMIGQLELNDRQMDYLIGIRPDLFNKESPVDHRLPDSSILDQPYEFSTQGHGAREDVELPEIKSVDQKGLGLKTLRESLGVLHDANAVPYPQEMSGTKEEKDKAWHRARQQALENNVINAAVKRWRIENEHMQKMGISSALQSRPMEALIWQWHQALEPAIAEELKAVRKTMEDGDAEFDGSTRHSRLQYGPYLEYFTSEKLAAVTIISVLHNLVRKRQEGLKTTEIALK
ncbi:hypothetical protein LTS18_001664, partial [Coniosporium uncinatum]